MYDSASSLPCQSPASVRPRHAAILSSPVPFRHVSASSAIAGDNPIRAATTHTTDRTDNPESRISSPRSVAGAHYHASIGRARICLSKDVRRIGHCGDLISPQNVMAGTSPAITQNFDLNDRASQNDTPIEERAL